MIDVGDVRLDLDFRVDLAEMIGCRNRFRQTVLGVAFGEHRLPLKIRSLHEIAIDDAYPANTGAAKCFCLRCSQCATADNEGARRLQAALPFFANSVEKNLSTVTVVHCISV